MQLVFVMKFLQNDNDSLKVDPSHELMSIRRYVACLTLRNLLMLICFIDAYGVDA